jgi:hypothetical protein
MQRRATCLSELEKKEQNWNRINLEFPQAGSNVEGKLGTK